MIRWCPYSFEKNWVASGFKYSTENSVVWHTSSYEVLATAAQVLARICLLFKEKGVVSFRSRRLSCFMVRLGRQNLTDYCHWLDAADTLDFVGVPARTSSGKA
jgi:hypothetical protein